MWYKHHPFVMAIVILTFLSSTSPPLIHFRHYRFAGSDDMVAVADALKLLKRTTPISQMSTLTDLISTGWVKGFKKSRGTQTHAQVWLQN